MRVMRKHPTRHNLPKNGRTGHNGWSSVRKEQQRTPRAACANPVLPGGIESRAVHQFTTGGNMAVQTPSTKNNIVLATAHQVAERPVLRYATILAFLMAAFTVYAVIMAMQGKAYLHNG